MVCLSALCSHLCRAARWLILLKPLKAKNLSLWNSFSAIMFGYAVNVVVPRGGELVRLISLSRSEGLAWAGVLPTLLIDRLLDIALLALVLGGTLAILPPSITKTMPWIGPSGIGLSLTTIIVLLILPRLAVILRRLLSLKPINQILSAHWQDKLNELIRQFEEGTKALTDPLAYPSLAFLSVVIWIFYWLNIYLMVFAFHLEKQVTITATIIVYALASASVLIPTPGSIGSFHLVAKQALMLTAGVDENMALAFVTVLHALTFVVISVVASVFCLSVNAWRKRA